MKQLFKTTLALVMAAIMSVAMISVAAAEEASPEENSTGITTSFEDDGSKAYELVWKYKEENGHLYRRRWNKTLNCWYDPAWILVY